MTKWARMRKRKERKRAEEALRRVDADGKEVKLVEPEKISEVFVIVFIKYYNNYIIPPI